MEGCDGICAVECGEKMIKKGKETYKKPTQYGIMLNQQQFTLMVNDKTVPMGRIWELVGNLDFTEINK